MQIRPYRASDRAAVVDLWQVAGLMVPWNDPLADLATYLNSDQGLLVVAADDADRVVGTAMAGFDGHRGWIYYLAVAPHQRRRGIGQALVRHCEAELARRGCPKVNLMVRATNAEAAGFYRALGYADSDVSTLGRRLD